MGKYWKYYIVKYHEKKQFEVIENIYDCDKYDEAIAKLQDKRIHNKRIHINGEPTDALKTEIFDNWEEKKEFTHVKGLLNTLLIKEHLEPIL